MRVSPASPKESVLRSVAKFESFLGLSPDLGPGELLRLRFVYMISWMFIATQVVNWFGMWHSYGGLHAQHFVSFGACFALAAISALPRWTRSRHAFGAAFTVLILGAVVSSVAGAAHPFIGGGINTSLLPILALGPVVLALVSDWRWVTGYTIMGLLFITGLFFSSLAALNGVPDAALAIVPSVNGVGGREAFAINYDQRFTQAAVSLIVTSCVVAPFGHRLYKIYDRLEAAVAKARAAEAAKGDFLAQMSHEIRTPLNGVISMSDLLTQQELPPSAAKPAEIISTASQHLMDLVNDVLDTARLEAGRLEITTAPFDLQGTLEALLDVHRQTAEDKGLWLGLDWQTGLPGAVIGDEARVRQVVANFVSNALKFTQAGGVRVAVRGAAVGETVRLKIFVQDTGTGIAAGELGGVFERYVQSASGRAQGAKGTGLGLAITRELAELMGGSVGVTSRVGEGSCFHVALDLARADAPAPRDAQPEPVRELTWLERRGSRAA